MALMDPYGLSLMSVETWGILIAFTSLGFIVGGIARRAAWPRREPGADAAARERRHVDRHDPLPDPLGDPAARHRLLHLPGARAGRRGIRADGHPEGRAVRGAGPRVRASPRPSRRRRADHGVPDRADRAVLDPAVDDGRRAGGRDRAMVRHRTRARDGVDLHRRRDHRADRDAGGPAVRPYRRLSDRYLASPSQASGDAGVPAAAA